MAPFVRKEVIERADQLVTFARTLFNEKRSESLRKAAKLYKDATLSRMSEMITREADDWDLGFIFLFDNEETKNKNN